MNAERNIPDLIPLTQWNQYFVDPSVSALRWMVFSNPDFESRCVLRRGRRILIDAAAYRQWLKEGNVKRSSTQHSQA